MDPVLAGLVPIHELYEDRLPLEAFSLMNDALAVRSENEARMREALERDQ